MSCDLFQIPPITSCFNVGDEHGWKIGGGLSYITIELQGQERGHYNRATVLHTDEFKRSKTDKSILDSIQKRKVHCFYTEPCTCRSCVRSKMMFM